LLKGVGNVECADLFVVLELEELVTSVSGHVNEDVGPIIGQEPFRTRYRRVDSTWIRGLATSRGKKQTWYKTCQETDEVLHGHFVTPVIDFDVIPVQIEALSGVGVHVSGKFVAVVTSCVIREHKDDIGVWNTESFYGAIPVGGGSLVSAGKQFSSMAYIPRALAICYGDERLGILRVKDTREDVRDS
jgi:hypothetical protein